VRLGEGREGVVVLGERFRPVARDVEGGAAVVDLPPLARGRLVVVEERSSRLWVRVGG